MNKIIRLFILLSIILNFLLLGVILGHVFKVMEKGYYPPEINTSQINISPKKIEKIQQQLHALHSANQDIFLEINQQRTKALQLLTATPFDGHAYKQQVNIIQALRAKATQRVADAVTAMALKMDINQRLVLAEILRNPRPPPPRVN